MEIRRDTAIDPVRSTISGMVTDESEKTRGILFLNHEFPPVGGGAGKSTDEVSRFFPSSRVMTMRYKERLVSCPDIISIGPDRTDPSHCGMIRMVFYAMTACYRVVTMPSIKKPRMIVAYFTIPAGIAAMMISVIAGIPYIVWLRGGDVPGFMPKTLGLYHRLLRPLIHHVWKRASVVASNGKFLKDLAERSLPGLHVVDIPNGIEVPEKVPQKPAMPLTVVFACRLVFEQKGVEILPDVWRNIRERFRHLSPRLVIIGDGPAMGYLKHNLDHGDVIFTGWLERHQVMEWMNMSHIFLYLSIFEGVSNALLEALSMGNLVCLNPHAMVPCSVDAPGVFADIQNIDMNDFNKLSAANHAYVRKHTWEQAAARLDKEIQKTLNAWKDRS